MAQIPTDVNARVDQYNNPNTDTAASSRRFLPLVKGTPEGALKRKVFAISSRRIRPRRHSTGSWVYEETPANTSGYTIPALIEEQKQPKAQRLLLQDSLIDK